MKTYLIVLNGEERGPYFLDQLRLMWNCGAITVDTFYWTEGMTEWKPAAELLNGVAVHEEKTVVVPPPLPTKAQPASADPIHRSSKEMSPNKPHCKRCGAPYREWSVFRAMGSGLCASCSKDDASVKQEPLFIRELTSREDALKVIKVTAICYLGLAALNIVIAEGDPALYFAAIVHTVGSLFMWQRNSRAAAVGLLCFCIVGLISTLATGGIRGLVPYGVLTCIQLLFTVKATEATFALHGKYANPSPPDGEIAPK